MGTGFFGAFIQGMISLSQARKHENYIRLGLEMLISFGLAFAGTWSATGLAVLQSTNSPLMAITTGFLTGLGIGAGAAYVRFATSKYSKDLGLTVPQVVELAGQEIKDNGAEIQK